MKFYDLHTTFTFGQYLEQTLQDVIQKVGWHYIEWCILNQDSFVLSKEVFEVYIDFVVSDHEVIEAHECKIEKYTDQGRYDYSDDFYLNHDPDNESHANDDIPVQNSDFQSNGMEVDAIKNSLGF